jgi:hypothetical protein
MPSRARRNIGIIVTSRPSIITSPPSAVTRPAMA